MDAKNLGDVNLGTPGEIVQLRGTFVSGSNLTAHAGHDQAGYKGEYAVRDESQ